MSNATFSGKVDSFEKEIGFKIFDRSNKGVSLSLAGHQFCLALDTIASSMEEAIARGRTAAGKTDVVNLSLPMRSCMRRLPGIVREYRAKRPSAQLNVGFCYDGRQSLANLVEGRSDVIFTFASFVEGHREIAKMHLFNSMFFVLVGRDDPLAARRQVGVEDLAGRSLFTNVDFSLVESNPPEIVRVHREVLESGLVRPVFCTDHNRALFDVACGDGVLLTVGFSDDGSSDLVRIPFKTANTAPCVLAVRRDDARGCVKEFLQICHRFYHEG